MKPRLDPSCGLLILGFALTQSLSAFQDFPIRFSAGTVQLAGTLTVPETPGPYPALVLIAGGQAIDRDCSYSGGRYEFFKVLAGGLADHGFATVRYDSPGIGGSTGGKWDQRTLNDRAEEVGSALALLKEDKRIDPHRVGLLGHSEGSDVAVIVATSNKAAAYLVLLSPHARSVRKSFSGFRSYLVKENGGSESQQAQADWDKFYSDTVFPAVEKGETDWQKILEQAKTIARKTYDHLPQNEQSRFKGFDDYFASTVDNFYLTYAPTALPHLQSIMDFDPVKFYERIRVPVLLVGGETDYYGQDLPVLAEAVRKGGDTNCVTRVMPKAGHILDNPSVSNEKPVPELLPTISGWLERAAPPVPPK